jgi:hypothetical protein
VLPVSTVLLVHEVSVLVSGGSKLSWNIIGEPVGVGVGVGLAVGVGFGVAVGLGEGVAVGA